MKILRNARYAHRRRWTSARLRRYHMVEKRKTQKVAISKINTQSHISFLSLTLSFLPLTNTEAPPSVSKYIFLSITQTPPSCVCQRSVKLLNSGTTSVMFTEMRKHVSPHCQRDRDWGHKERKEKGKRKGFGSVPRWQKGGEESAAQSRQRWDCRTRSSAEAWGLLPALRSFYFHPFMKLLRQCGLFFMDYWSIWSKVITDVYKYEKKKHPPKNSTFCLYIVLEGSQVSIAKADIFQEAIIRLSNHS